MAITGRLFILDLWEPKRPKFQDQSLGSIVTDPDSAGVFVCPFSTNRTDYEDCAERALPSPALYTRLFSVFVNRPYPRSSCRACWPEPETTLSPSTVELW